MLKNLDPILTPDLLWCLRAMGHGDDIVIVDANFPAVSVAKSTVFGRAIQLTEVDTGRTLRALLSLMPLDSYVPNAIHRMEVVDHPATIPPVMQEAQAIVDEIEGEHTPIASYERHAFYEAAKKTFAIVQTGESRGYGNLIIKKGVILADG